MPKRSWKLSVNAVTLFFAMNFSRDTSYFACSRTASTLSVAIVYLLSYSAILASTSASVASAAPFATSPMPQYLTSQPYLMLHSRRLPSVTATSRMLLPKVAMRVLWERSMAFATWAKRRIFSTTWSCL